MMPQIDEVKLKCKPRILLVEDEPIAQREHRLQLEKLSCVVDLAATGLKALAMYKNGYQLILLDCGLPDISGIEVGKIIRQYEHEHDLVRVPIVMVTAFINDADLQQECKNAGIDELINKPISANAGLQTILERWLVKYLIS